MKKCLYNLIRKYHLLFIGIILISVANNIHWGKDKYKKIIESDGKGYYAYLPAVFIYHDLNFNFFDEMEAKYSNKHLYYDYRQQIGERFINKYYCGTAIAELPFFLIAHLHTYVIGLPQDGYSKYYPIWINIGAILYLLLGLYYLRRTFFIFGISERDSIVLLLAITFGTNAYCYTILDPGMSHIYSFAFVSMFVYYSILLFQKFEGSRNKFETSKQLFYILSVLLGIIVLIRPINILLILVMPFLAFYFYRFKNAFIYFFSNVKIFIPCLFFFCGIIAIQFLIYKIQIDQYFVYSYGEEGFDFWNPEIFNILFSYKKGLFLYTPLTFISLFGFYYLFKENKYQFWSLSLFLFILTYFLSSWWNWWYGGSFSSRVYVEYFPIIFIPLGLLLKESAPFLTKKMLYPLIFILIIVCQIQTYQFKYYIIHYDSMTKEKYWDNFLRIDKLILFE